MHGVYATTLASILAILPVCLIGGCERGAGVASVPPRSEATVRVGSFHVGGLSLPGQGSGTPERLERLAIAIRLADADVLALQDVDSLEALEAFRDAYLAGLGYGHVASLDVEHQAGAENAVLSRLPLSNPRVWPRLRLAGEHPPTVHGEPNPFAGEPLLFRCSPLMVDVGMQVADGAGVPFGLVLVSLDHKGGDKYRYWREAEAEAVVGLADRFAEGRPVLVVGSFHDERGSRTVDTYLESGFRDLFAGHGERARVVTEASGDRTDLLLIRGVPPIAIDQDATFVVGDAADESLAGLEHFPVVTTIRVGG